MLPNQYEEEPKILRSGKEESRIKKRTKLIYERLCLKSNAKIQEEENCSSQTVWLWVNRWIKNQEKLDIIESQKDKKDKEIIKELDIKIHEIL